MMVSLFSTLLKGGSAFYPLEKRILEEVQFRLDTEGRTRLQRQVEVVNKIQRLSDGKEVNLYQMRHGKPAFDDCLRFPHAADEELLASAIVTGPDQRAKLKAEVWLAKGRLFSLVFNISPKQFYAGTSLKAVKPEIADVKIWLDPMRPRPAAVEKPVDPSALTGWLRKWYAQGRVTRMHAPLPESEHAACLARVDAKFPPDYLDLIAQTEGATLPGCMVYGAAGIRQVIGPDANYYILAEIEELGALAVKDGQRNAELYLLDYEDNDARPLGESLEAVLQDLLTLD